MPITLNCPKCHKPFRVRDESIGGRVRCPSCGSELQVPAALSPASNFDDVPASEHTNSPRPVAEDVRGRSMPEMRLGDPGRRDDVVSFDPPPAHMAAGPPSIKARVPMAPQGPLPPRMENPPSVAKQLPRAATDTPRPNMKSLVPPTGEQTAWAGVASGLRMIRWGLFLFAIVPLAFFGHGMWVTFDFERAMKDGPGLLKKDDWPLWKEVMLAYTAGPILPALLLLLIGRTKCCRVPSSAHARGLILGALFFQIIAIAGFGLYIGMSFFDLNAKMQLPAQTRLTSLFAAIPSVLLSDILTLLYIGQLGWPIGRPSLQKSIATFFAYALLLPAGIAIGMLWAPVYPDMMESWKITGLPLGEAESDTAKRALIWSVVILAGVVMLFLRYAGVAGSARRGIRKLIGA